MRARRGAIEGLTVSKLQMCNVKSTRLSTKRISVVLDGYLKTTMTPIFANANTPNSKQAVATHFIPQP